MNKFQLGRNWLGPDEPTYFIADIAANHDGDLSRAKRLIEMCKDAGADAAKFQNFQAAKIVSKGGFETLGGQIAHQAKWKKSVYEVYQQAEVDIRWSETLKEHCERVKIAYFTSPYDVESTDLVDPYIDAFKIGSGEITFPEALAHIARKKKVVFLATGASTLSEVIEAVRILKEAGGSDLALCVMQCNTNYTGSLENFRFINLNVLKTFATIFPDVLLGLSDHTPGHATVLGAVALGARVIEKHFTDDNTREGPDHPFSMNPKTWCEMVDRTRELERALGTTEKKIEENERDSAIVQRRALYLTRPIGKGEVITADALAALRPAPLGSVTPNQRHLITGMLAPRNFQAGDCLRWIDWR